MDTIETLIELLESNHYKFERTADGVTVTHNSDVYLGRLTTLPDKMSIKDALTRSASSSYGQTLRRNLEFHGYTESEAV